MTLQGSSVYDEEVADLMRRLEAKGIFLIVVDGKKNNSPIEYASAIQPQLIPRTIEVLLLVAQALQKDWMEVRLMSERKDVQ